MTFLSCASLPEEERCAKRYLHQPEMWCEGCKAALERLRVAVFKTPTEQAYGRVRRSVIEAADALAGSLPKDGLPEGELRMALGNWRLHRNAHRRKRLGRRIECTKCAQTSERLLTAQSPL